MKEYILHMQREYNSLDEKIAKAQKALKELELDKVEKVNLIKQLNHMKSYLEVLNFRINYAVEKEKKR